MELGKILETQLQVRQAHGETTIAPQDIFIYMGKVIMMQIDIVITLEMDFFKTQQYLVQELTRAVNGKFEYDVPTGYTALCTKGLND